MELDIGELSQLYEQYGTNEKFNQLPKGQSMKLPFVFDANQVSPQQAILKLPISPPEGWPAVIVANEFKATKDATPQNPASYLMFTLEIIDGPHRGAKGFDRLNLQNSNQQTVDIAYARLSSYCHVTGVFRTDEMDMLMNRPLRIVVIEDPKDARYTTIWAVKDINGNDPEKVPTQPAQPPQYQQPPAQPQTYQQPPQEGPAAWQPPGANPPPVAPWQK